MFFARHLRYPGMLSKHVKVKIIQQNIWLVILLISISGGFLGCSSSKLIRGNGLKYLQLGDPMPEIGTVKIKGHAVRDTVFNEGGYIWRASILKYDKGKVYVEEDFLGKGIVNRIRIESPELIARKTVSVGMPIISLKTISEDWEVTYLADYELLDVVSVSYPTIHYLIKETKIPESSFEEKEHSINDLSDDAKIVAIVVM